VTITELARRLGVTLGPVSRRVSKFAALGLIEVRMKGAQKLVDFRAFADAVARTEDGVRAANGRLARRGGDVDPLDDDDDAGEPILAKEQAKKAKHQAELARIAVAEKLGQLLPIKDIENAAANVGGMIIRCLEAHLVMCAGEQAAAVVRDGEQGLRAYNKAMIREIRERLVAGLAPGLPADAEGDDVIKFVDIEAPKPEPKLKSHPPTGGNETITPQRGRPVKHEGEPWKAAGVSRATYFRRLKAEARA
jgi:hypothetical protein